jgi:PhzF family phenazine biosynthesis protein
MSEAGQLFRLTAFSDSESGGNPAGVWIGDELPGKAEMQEIAADVGYSETAFIAPKSGLNRTVRYFSPLAEVTFCGHATIASGVVLGRGEGEGTYQFETLAGLVPVKVGRSGGHFVATLVSVATRHRTPVQGLLDGALTALNWSADELDPAIPPMNAYAGAWHLVLAVKTKARLDDLDYDFDALKQLMLDHDLTTLQLIWRENDKLIHSRNPFPVGGVVEDPATGAAAAALGGYLRDAKLIEVPTTFKILQGVVMGRPSHLTVDVPATGGIEVTGTAVDIQ